MRETADRTTLLIRGMAGRIAELEQGAASIADSVCRQGQATEAINRNVREAATNIGSVAECMGELQAGASENQGLSAGVQGAAEQVDRRSAELRVEVEQYIKATDEAADWRSFKRYDCSRAIRLACDGSAPFSSSLLNISRSGAAVHCSVELLPGAPCVIHDLLDAPLRSRAVAWDVGVLRVHFDQEGDTPQKIAGFINLLSDQAEAA